MPPQGRECFLKKVAGPVVSAAQWPSSLGSGLMHRAAEWLRGLHVCSWPLRMERART